MGDSGRLVGTGGMRTTPRSIGAPAPIKRKHLALRSPRGGYPDSTTPRAATQGSGASLVPKMPVPPSQPRREAGSQAAATASARGFRPLVREGINPSKHRAPVPDELYATIAQEVRARRLPRQQAAPPRELLAGDNSVRRCVSCPQVPPELADPADWRVMAESHNVGPMVRTQVGCLSLPPPCPAAPLAPLRPVRSLPARARA